MSIKPEVMQKKLDLSKRLAKAISKKPYPDQVGALLAIIMMQVKLPDLEKVVSFQERE